MLMTFLNGESNQCLLQVRMTVGGNKKLRPSDSPSWEMIKPTEHKQNRLKVQMANVRISK